METRKNNLPISSKGWKIVKFLNKRENSNKEKKSDGFKSGTDREKSETK